jgi:predicted Rossmann-fold nucleotide-binding protein
MTPQNAAIAERHPETQRTRFNREADSPLRKARIMAARIIAGEKPVLDSDTEWIFEQMTRMKAGHFISEIPWSYVTRPGDDAKALKFKGENMNHSFGHALYRQIEALNAVAEKDGIRNYKIMGADYGYRFPNADPLAQKDDADAFVLTPGDMPALQQFLALLEKRPEGKTLIVQNDGGFWNPLIGALDPSVRITSGPAETKAVLENLPDREKPARRSDRGLQIRPGDVVLICTGNNNKGDELRRCLEAAGARVFVKPFNSFIGRTRTAEEASHSGTGNNHEKMMSVCELIERDTLESIVAYLKSRGIDADRVTIWFDDRSLDVPDEIMKAEEFDKCRDDLNPHKPMPGAELAPILKVMPLREFYERIRDAANRNRTVAPGEPLGEAEDTQVYTVMRLAQKDYKNPEFYSFHSVNKNHLFGEPRVKDPDDPVYSEHFHSVIDAEENPRGLRNSENPDYLKKLSPMAKACRAAASVLGMGNHKADVARQFRLAAQDKRQIATPNNAGAGHPLFNDPRNKQTAFERTGKNWTRRYGDFSPAMSGFFWGPQNDPALEHNEKNFWENMYQFFKLVVDNQVFNADIRDKPLVIEHAEGRKTCGAALDIYNHLHKLGFIGDKPDNVIKQTRSPEETVEAFEKRFGFLVENRNSNSKWKTVETGRERNDLYTVTVYCSATSEAKELRDAASRLNRCLAALGFGAKNGGGSEGLMSASSKGVMSARAWWKNESGGKYGPMPDNHLSVIQCMDTAKAEGVYEHTDHCRVYGTMDDREHDLRRCNAEIVMAGGAGTVRELIGSIVTRLRGGPETVRNRPLVIVNMDFSGKKIFAPVVRLLSEKLRRELNIHVVDRWQDALKIAVEQRREARREPKNLPWQALREEFFGLDAKDCRDMEPAAARPVRQERTWSFPASLYPFP